VVALLRRAASCCRSVAAVWPLSSDAVWETGSQTVCQMRAEDRTPECTTRCTPCSTAPPTVVATRGLHRAFVPLRCCTFRGAGARAAREWLTCHCVSAVPQVCTPCPASQSPCPIARSRVRAVRLHVFSGRSVQRWPRTRRSSDPLQQRSRRLYFQPQAVLSHGEFESGVGIRVRSRPDELAGAAAASSTSAARPCRMRSEHLPGQAGCVRAVALMPANIVGHRQVTYTTVGEAVLQVSVRDCVSPLSSRMHCSC